MSKFTFDPALVANHQVRQYQVELVEELVATTTPLAPGDRLRVQVATGGGKNAISNDFLARRAFEPALRVLSVTKDWPLLGQQASDLCRRYQGAAARIGYVGRGGRREFEGVGENVAAQIVYSTVQTWDARRDTDFSGLRYDIVVIDEVHWGDDAPLYERLLASYAGSSIFIGLSATPRKGTSFRLIGRAWDFANLVGLGVLAMPEVVSVPTRVRWAPRRAGRTGDVTARSLAELGRNAARNRLIIDTYRSRAGEFGKTLVFACDIGNTPMFSTARCVPKESGPPLTTRWSRRMGSAARSTRFARRPSTCSSASAWRPPASTSPTSRRFC